MRKAFNAAAARVRDLPPKERPKMKERLLTEAAQDPELAGSALRVLVVIVARIFWETGSTRPLGRLDLQIATGLSRATVTRAITALVEKEFLFSVHERKPRQCTPAVYTVVLRQTEKERNGY